MVGANIITYWLDMGMIMELYSFDKSLLLRGHFGRVQEQMHYGWSLSPLWITSHHCEVELNPCYILVGTRMSHAFSCIIMEHHRDQKNVKKHM